MEFTKHWKTRIGVAIAKGVGGAVVREGKRQETEYKRWGRVETQQYGLE